MRKKEDKKDKKIENLEFQIFHLKLELKRLRADLIRAETKYKILLRLFKVK